MKTGKQALKIMDFATVVSDKKLRNEGFSKGDIVLVTSYKSAMPNKNKPYEIVNYPLVVKVEGGLAQIPDKGNDYKGYIVDGNNLEWVGEDLQESYEQDLKVQYGTS